MPDGEKAVCGSRTRTLVDAVYDWSRFNGIPRAYRWIREEMRRKRVTAAELVRDSQPALGRRDQRRGSPFASHLRNKLGRD